MSKNPVKTVYSIYNGLEQAVSALVAAMIEYEAATEAFKAAREMEATSPHVIPEEVIKRYTLAGVELNYANAVHADKCREYEAFKATLPAVA